MFSKLVQALPGVVLALALPVAALAQTQVPFGGLSQDTSLPVEVTSDSLTVDQADGSATFVGNVVIAQGTMRLSAAQVRVEYAGSPDNTGRIEKLVASGGVTLVNGTEAAESRDAVYTIDDGIIVMTGDVILTQGRNALSSQRLVVDLVRGTGTLDGGVQTILQTGSE